MPTDDNQYYYLTIGPVSRKLLDKKYPNGESGLREAVKAQFHIMFPGHDYECASGWGVTREMEAAARFATYDDELKKSLIGSYHNENKPLPRALKAWELLFESESKKKIKYANQKRQT
jgi:hypothetical protein